MQQTDLVLLEKWFSQYVTSFYLLDDDVRNHVALKEKHTAKVVEHSRALVEWLGLSAADTLLAECIALFHDVGRFKQYAKYRTFVDHKSVDHAQMGLEVVENLPQLCLLSGEERELFDFSIANHNTMRLPAVLDERTRLFATIIRDADKLDIYRVLADQLAAPPAGGYSPVIVRELLAGTQSSYTEMRTADDKKLMRLSWIYDINYTWTLRRVVDAGYVDEIIRHLYLTPEVEEIIVRLKRYIDRKLG